MELKLDYNLPEKYKVSTNKIYSWVHWSKRKDISDFFHALVMPDCRQLNQLKWKFDLHFIFTFEKRPLDSSNCSFMAKCLEDWFVNCWLLLWDTIEYVWKFSVESKKGKKNKIEVFFKKNLTTVK